MKYLNDNKYKYKWNGKADGVSLAILNSFSETDVELLWKKQTNVKYKIQSFYRVCHIFNNNQKDIKIQDLCRNFLTKNVNRHVINPPIPSPSSLCASIRIDNIFLFQLMFPNFTIRTANECLDLACKFDSIKIMDFLVNKYHIQINYDAILISIRNEKFAWVLNEHYWNKVHARDYFILILKFTNNFEILKCLYDISKINKASLQIVFVKKCNEIVHDDSNFTLLKWMISLLD